ncbi:hypothetical protein DSM106972_062620 [Dulcicalothrix desertica PCC 7102]|uniref:Transposase n=1 Tax=Dulcicalothrix desertica PCC 7102 TaxID=232991 RepID=A0A3S1CF10_9CYAN|nr:hypothetical protein [Dulcicalothrix desertica]RUT02187.1 hypothetical protein DSM106972_062620 [Dulcicalothrix desertica PCC 7102]
MGKSKKDKCLMGIQQNLIYCDADTKAILTFLLDGDSLPEHGKKPVGWKASGRRYPRGLYRTKNGSLINADLQAAANILRKVAGNLGIDLSRLGRCCLTSTSRVRIWATKLGLTKKNPLSQGS